MIYGLEEPIRVPTIDMTHILEKDTGSVILLKDTTKQLSGTHKYYLMYGAITTQLENFELNLIDGFIEATSGNTGLALAYIGHKLGKQVLLYTHRSIDPIIKEKLFTYDNVSMQFFDDIEDAQDKVLEDEKNLAKSFPTYFHLNQYSALSGAIKGFEYLARDIAETVPDITEFIHGVGTGGTISGIAEFFGDRVYTCACVAIDDTLTIPGWKNPNFNRLSVLTQTANELGYIDKWYQVTVLDALKFRTELQIKHNFSCNLSTAGNLLAAKRHGEKFSGAIIVTLKTG